MTQPPYPNQPNGPQGWQPQPGQPQQGQPHPGQPQQGQPGQPFPGQPQQSFPGQPPQGPGGPGATLTFTVQGSALTSSMVPPVLTIDGTRAPTSSSGSVMLPIPPGPHRLEVYAQWMRKYGQAELDINVQPNTTLEVFYAPPFHQFTRGAMGFEPQKRAGVGCLVALLAFLALVLLISIISVIVGTLG